VSIGVRLFPAVHGHIADSVRDHHAGQDAGMAGALQAEEHSKRSLECWPAQPRAVAVISRDGLRWRASRLRAAAQSVRKYLLVSDDATSCRTVRQIGRRAAAWCRPLPGRTATSEQTWSKHGGGHWPRRQIRSVISPASVAASEVRPGARDRAEDRGGSTERGARTHGEAAWPEARCRTSLTD
jgi:hypothetical protein